MIKKEKFRLVWQSPPPFEMHVACTNYNNFKKEQTILNQKSITINVRKKSIYCLPDDFSSVNEFPNFFLKNERKSIVLI